MAVLDITLQIILLLIGFVFLIKGADIFVDGASSIASYLKIPTLIVGLTIVAFGTSMPEASVSILSSLNGSNAIAVANVIGSNLFNILVIIGLCASLKVLPLEKVVVKRDMPILVIISILLGLFIITDWSLSRIEGIVLLCIIIAYVAYLVYDAKKDGKAKVIKEPTISIEKSIAFIVLGLVGIILGGDLVVNSSTFLASTFGMSETLIGLTIVAIGTSLPELVTSLTALRKGETGIVIGNVIGSNIFNILFVLGASSAISAMTLSPTILVDLLLLIGTAIICLIFAFTDVKFDRKEGLVLLLIFVMYMTFAIIRN